MPRPKKSRQVCGLPQTVAFETEGRKPGGAAVVLTVEEYEAIRLIDKEGLSQEQCSASMQVARTTVQQIYSTARKKMADALVEGLTLRIEGGDYRLCNGYSPACGCRSCPKRAHREMNTAPKGEQVLRIAVTYENGEVFQHFGHTRQFKLYDVNNGVIMGSSVVDTNGSGHGALAGVLSALQVDALICGGIGGGAQAALAAAGIKLYGGVSGSADRAAQALAAGALAYNPDVMCNHHGEHHHDGGCGSHNCGQ